MDTPRFIICDALVGAPRVPMDGPAPTVQDLQSEMARLRVSSAIVRHRLCLEGSPYFANNVLMEEIQGQPNLIATWILTPDGVEPDFDIAATVKAMLQSGAKAVWLAPQEHGYSLAPWCCGKMYEVLQARRVPLFIEYNRITGDEIHQICSEFPDLRLVLLGLPRLGRNRILYPLLKRHQNIYLCYAPPFSIHEGLLDLCNNFGPARWLLGTNYPVSEGGAGIAGLMYSGLDQDAIRAVAHENIERLLSEVASA
jgi:hypothetical protein